LPVEVTVIGTPKAVAVESSIVIVISVAVPEFARMVTDAVTRAAPVRSGVNDDVATTVTPVSSRAVVVVFCSKTIVVGIDVILIVLAVGTSITVAVPASNVIAPVHVVPVAVILSTPPAGPVGPVSPDGPDGPMIAYTAQSVGFEAGGEFVFDVKETYVSPPGTTATSFMT
jgi:hypothetical protein